MTEKLKVFFNLASLTGQPARSFEEIAAAGYSGLQFGAAAAPCELELCRQLSLDFAASGRVNEPRDADQLARQWARDQFVCATLHVGWGLEGDTQAAELIESVLAASQRHKVPLYVETHRATIFQDMWRTVGFVSQFPELRFNGDFSHWYTGQEMVYGGFESKVAFIQPVLERVRFLHGRIGNPGCMQVKVGPHEEPEAEYITHFRRLWTTCFRHGATIFAPELLHPEIYYARTFLDYTGKYVEESDRWEQSLLLKRIAEECFHDSQVTFAPSPHAP